MKILSVAISTIISVLLLTGCTEKTPDDALTSKVLRNYANQDLVSGLEVTDFKRDNGWVDTNSPNRYVVRYAYNLKLIKDLPEVVLDLAKVFQNEVSEEKKNPGFMGLGGSVASFNLTLGGSNWIRAQADGFPARRDTFLGRCAVCIAYWNQEGTSDEATERRMAYATAWSHLEGLGFRDTATVGNTVGRITTATFYKTEKGWAEVK